MTNLNAPGYRKYPGVTGLNRRDNAAAIIRRSRGRNIPGYENAYHILTVEFGYTLDDIIALTEEK